MTSQDEKYRRYVEIGESVGLFVKSLMAAVAAAAGRLVEWARRHRRARSRALHH